MVTFPLTTRPTGVTSKTVPLIDNIFTNFIFETLFRLKKGTIRKLPGHFPVFISLNSSLKIYKENKKIANHKRVTHQTNPTTF